MVMNDVARGISMSWCRAGWPWKWWLLHCARRMVGFLNGGRLPGRFGSSLGVLLRYENPVIVWRSSEGSTSTWTATNSCIYTKSLSLSLHTYLSLYLCLSLSLSLYSCLSIYILLKWPHFGSMKSDMYTNIYIHVYIYYMWFVWIIDNKWICPPSFAVETELNLRLHLRLPSSITRRDPGGVRVFRTGTNGTRLSWSYRSWRWQFPCWFLWSIATTEVDVYIQRLLWNGLNKRTNSCFWTGRLGKVQDLSGKTEVPWGEVLQDQGRMDWTWEDIAQHGMSIKLINS